MGFFDCFCCCFGRRVETDDIVQVLSARNGFTNIASSHGIKDMTRADCTSCNTTAIIIGQMIQGTITGSTPGSIADITDGMQARMAVIVNLKPDHWFCILPGEEDDEVIILQSYQDLYTLEEWLNSRAAGTMRRDVFNRALAAILAGPAPDEAVRLFARNGTDAATISRDFAAKASIATVQRVGSFKWKKI